MFENCEVLLGVIALRNREITPTTGYTEVGIQTNKGTYFTKIPYFVEKDYQNSDNFRVRYTTSVKDYCKSKHIRTKEYFNVIHKDIEEEYT